MRISDWSSDVCSSDLDRQAAERDGRMAGAGEPDRRLDAERLFHVGGRGESKRRPCRPRRPLAPARLAWLRDRLGRSDERRVGKRVSVRVELGGGGSIKKKKNATDRANREEYST